MMLAHRALLALVSALLFSPQIWGSSAVIDVTLSPAGSFKAKINGFRGFAIKNGDTVEAQNIVVDLEGLETGIELRDTHTKQFLEIEKYPEATLISAKGKDGKGVGRVRIRGIEKEVAGTYRINNDELNAEFKLNLPDFNIKDVSYMGVSVNDTITLHVTIPIKPASAASMATEPAKPLAKKSTKHNQPKKKKSNSAKAATTGSDRCFVTLPGGEFLELKNEKTSGQTNAVFVYSERGESSDKIATNLGKIVVATNVKLMSVSDVNAKSLLSSEDFTVVLDHLFKETPYSKGGAFEKWVSSEILLAEFKKCQIK